MAVKEKTESNEEPLEPEVEWNTADNELQLLQILCGNRPIGKCINVVADVFQKVVENIFVIFLEIKTNFLF